MKPPDFIVAGAPRSGTTWLWKLLDRHPGVYMARPVAPEPKFFLVDEIYKKGVSYYLRTWFADIDSTRQAGEKSTNYLESPVAARRIHDSLPEVKLLFLLREPVDRAFSNYLWSRSNGLESEDFETALELEQQRETDLPLKWRYSRPHAYFSRGLYADLLRPYYDLFPREQILCLRYDEIVERPWALAERVHRFLLVEPRPQDADNLGRIRPSEKKPQDEIPSSLRQRLEALYRDPNRRLAELLGPQFDLCNHAS